MLAKFRAMRIKKRLTTGFVMVSMITSIAALVGIIAMIVISIIYDNAMVNYGFSQGDIGNTMVAFAESRSSLRAVIGYDDNNIMNIQLRVHDEQKAAFEECLAEVEKYMVTDAGHESYNQILADLEGYWELDAEILELGTSKDPADRKLAQIRAADELVPHYERVYNDLAGLMEVNIQKVTKQKHS